MSERKVLNKYYPPDFDPSKIPRMKLAKNRQYTVRLMAPFNMRCITCGEYIYKGKKFNARKEDVEHEDYLGIRIYRFYIKCTRCLQEISFKTDPKNTDYEIEAGATRNFMALKLAEEQAKREEDELKEEEANNPMKLLENRTEQSRNEIELLESLEELKDLNRRQAAVDYDSMLQQYVGESAEDRRKREEKEDEEFVKSITFKNKSNSQKVIVTEEIIEDVDDDSSSQGPLSKRIKRESDEDNVNSNRNIPSVIQSTPNSTKPPFISKGALKSHDTWNKSIGTLPKRGGLSGLVKLNSKKPSSKNDGDSENLTNSQPLKPQVESTTEKSVVDKPESNITSTVTSNSLSLLGNYSGSDSNED